MSQLFENTDGGLSGSLCQTLTDIVLTFLEILSQILGICFIYITGSVFHLSSRTYLDRFWAKVHDAALSGQTDQFISKNCDQYIHLFFKLLLVLV
jgi:hypothetical protein